CIICNYFYYNSFFKIFFQILSAIKNAVRCNAVKPISKTNTNTMKNFMLIFRGGSDAVQLSPEESQQQMQKWFDWVGELQSKGIYTAGEALKPTPGKIVKK